MDNDQKPPTTAQRKLLTAINRRGVERRCYTSHTPGHVTHRWYWMINGTETKVSDRTISACLDREWVTEEIGNPIEGTDDWSPMQRAMHEKPRPRWLELTDAGREVLGLPKQN